MMQIARAPAARDGFIQHRAPLHLLHVLAEVADVQPLGNRHCTFVRLLLAHDHAKKRRLARAVGSNQADLFAGIQLKRSVDKNQLLAVLLIDSGKRDHSSIISATLSGLSESLSTVAQFLAVQMVESFESKYAFVNLVRAIPLGRCR